MELCVTGVPSDTDASDDDLRVEHERLEDNEELRLHILGTQTYWTQHPDSKNKSSLSPIEPLHCSILHLLVMGQSGISRPTMAHLSRNYQLGTLPLDQ